MLTCRILALWILMIPCAKPLWALSAQGVPWSPSEVTPPTAENVGREIRERTAKPQYVYPPDRLFEIGLAAGFPIVAAPEIGIQLFKHWQFGLTGALVPAGILPTVALPSITQTVPPGVDLTFNPTVNSSAFMISPFVRFFPTQRTFYLQLTWSIGQLNPIVTSGVTESLTGLTIPDASLTTSVSITGMFPTLSIGYFFWRHVYFFNISLGATVLLSANTQVSGTVTVPGPFGGALDGDAVINSVSDQIVQTTNLVVEQIRNVAPFFPSIMISTGIMF
jgi:hypothetical protein